MSRPPKCRRVEFLPNVTYFKPAGIPLGVLDEMRLSVEEAEAIRLKDLTFELVETPRDDGKPIYFVSLRIMAHAENKEEHILLGLVALSSFSLRTLNPHWVQNANMING